LSSPFAKGISILEEAALRVLHLPTVASKSFLITIGDRTKGGLVVRSQMVGPWQPIVLSRLPLLVAALVSLWRLVNVHPWPD